MDTATTSFEGKEPLCEEKLLESMNPTYYDDAGFLNKISFYWMRFWIHNVHKDYFKPSMLHPLPKADRIEVWQKIFSKHISDGLLQLEKAEYERYKTKGEEIKEKPHKCIILNALFHTFGSRVILMVLGTIFISVIRILMSITLNNTLDMISSGDGNVYTIILYVLFIAAMELCVSIIEQHITFYNCRLEAIMEGTISITLFQHGMSHRRAYAAYLENCPLRDNCKRIVHSWPCQNNECTQNPLKCPARRHQNKELPASIHTYLLLDTYALMAVVESLIIGSRFLTTLIAALVVIRYSLVADVLPAFYVVCVMVLVTVGMEVANGHAYLHSMKSKDSRYSKTVDVVSNMNVIKEMCIEDVCYNTTKNCRTDEMSVLFMRVILMAFNGCTMNTISTVIFAVVLLGYVRDMKANVGNKAFQVGGPITLLFIAGHIMKAAATLPRSVKIIMEVIASVGRVERFIRECSPNYYFSHNSNDREEDTPEQDNTQNEEISDDMLVAYKSAAFAWENNREAILKSESLESPLLKSMDFELKRGEVRIVTGPQGCGKTSFIKSILGEMSLVSGSMAVAPLSTGMPIFYTSQEVWLPTDSIRAIITFGYVFDEEIYNEVVRCAELLRDFSSWDDGDMRVISEKGYSLSGGQRVRVSLARALYAYMVFSKANESLENNRCCFLMCLDEPFNGLDVNVATAIFNNLFNKETGLLVRDDVAIVMAMSKTSVEVCFKSNRAMKLCNVFIHHLHHGMLSNGQYLSCRFRNIEVNGRCIAVDNGSLAPKHKALNYFPHEVIDKLMNGKTVSKCSNRLDGDTSNNEAKHVSEDIAKRTSGDTYRSYYSYFSTIGYSTWGAILLLVLTAIVVKQVISVFVAQWSDAVKAAEKSKLVKTGGIQSTIAKHEKVSYWVTFLSVFYMIFMYSGNILSTLAGLFTSKKLYEFAISSLFFRSSKELPIKNAMGDIITLLSADFYFIDEVLAISVIGFVYSLLQLLMQFVTICYTSPWVTPVPIVMSMCLYLLVAKVHILTCKRLQLFMFEAMGDIHGAYSNVISGASIYRSYRREMQCMQHIYECSDYFIRTRFLKKTASAWLMIVSTIFTTFMVLFVSIVPLIRSHISGDSVYVANIGLGITLTLELNSLITSLVYNCSLMEKMMCSMARYDHYFLQGKFSIKEKFESMDETILSGYGSTKEREKEDRRRLSDLIKRRKREFRNFAFRRYRSVMNTLFYKPKIKVLDIASYLPADHTSLTLDKVFVPQPAHNTAETSRYILKNVSASTQVGDVIGIVGRTGAGKSTLLGVLQNITRNREGSVLLDGRELSTIPRSVLRHIIGVLPQIPFVFQGWTLRRFLDPRMLYSDEAILNALECCGMLDTVMSLPGGKGLDAVLVPEELTSIGGLYLLTPIIKLKSAKVDTTLVKRESADVENSSSVSTMLFSMGQLRLLSFARLVLYRETYRILLVDEPPSDNAHGDEEGNKDSAEDLTDLSLPIYDLVKIYFKHCTTFIVAHDKRALKACGHIWVMESGEIKKVISGMDNVLCTIESFSFEG
ncbi:ATP-binding cassette sub-family C protein [Babesia gibsoni]|uniref:ATP-binding cassette sub-family C protein n=1 Tax=Babesia gibsoni TaxID=33632 RepID=A0AAD8PG87_BABGI|nr:ATP-binding cassette sub-family C protein [Babesia gibsoni]